MTDETQTWWADWQIWDVVWDWCWHDDGDWLDGDLWVVNNVVIIILYEAVRVMY